MTQIKPNLNKYICFSLWCQNNKLCKNKINENPNMYTIGAIRNLELASDIYPGWILRFYVDNTVPQKIMDNIRNNGGEIVDMTGSNIPGMYWRFLAIEDPNVDVFIVRDCDSRINKREQLAVYEWLNSDYILHIMRDHPHHYFPILGGTWGFKNYMKRINIKTRMEKFIRAQNRSFKRMDDMNFIAFLYDKYRKRTITHDEFFTFPDGKRKYFPEREADTGLPWGKSGKYYHFIGEIYDENDNNVNKERNRDLYANYRTQMRRHWSRRLWQTKC